MKAQSKRFVDHKGSFWPVQWTARHRDGDEDSHGEEQEADGKVGFLGLWRHATSLERVATLAGVLLALFSSVCTLSAVVIYGELTALFVARHKAQEIAQRTTILSLFGGGKQLPAGDRAVHMEALVDDSIAFGVCSAAIMVSQVVAAAAAVSAANWAASRMSRRIRLRLLVAALSQEAAFYDTHPDLNYGTALSQDCEALCEGTGEHVVMTSYLGGCVVVGAAVSLAHGWMLTLVGLAVIPLSLISAAVVAKIGSACAAKEATAYGVAGRGAQLALTHIQTVRAYGGEHVEVDRFDASLHAVSTSARRRGIAGAVGAGLGWLSTYSLSALVLAVGAGLVVRDMELPPADQEYDPGVLVTILFCSFMCCQNIALMHPHVEIFSVARGAASSIYRLLARTTRIDASATKGGIKPDAFRGDIQFKDVYFNYPSRPDVKVLRGVTLSVRAGETVALVGGSGCGKSTLLQLLQRLYEPDTGSVSVDGHQLDQLDLHHYRKSIGVVGQEPVLFSGSIHDNIALGANVTRDDVILAAKAAHAHQFIQKLTQGYDTVLGERGAQLSGGQKQRVAIARAILRRPAILLLDEPTSALDPVAERQVQAALDAASVGRTTIVVSHRLSTIENASRIVYLEQGAVLEQGTHQELMALKGAYYKLATADTTQTIPVSPSIGADDNDVVSCSDVTTPSPLRRALLVRHSTRASLASSSSIRSSRRFAAPLAPTPDTLAIDTQDMLEASEDCTPPASSWSLFRLSAPEWPLLLGGGVAALLVGAAMPAFAFLFSRIYGMFALSSGAEILYSSRLHAGLFALAAALCALSAAVQGCLLGEAGVRLTHRLRVNVLRNYLAQEQAWFELPQHAVGCLCARLASDCAAVHGATGARLGTVLQGVSTMVLGVALAMPYSWSMTLVSLISVPCVIGAITLEGVVSRRAQTARRGGMEGAARVAGEGIANVRTVQALAVESEIASRYAAALESSVAATKRSNWARGVAYGLCVSAPTLGYAVSLAYGGWLVARKGLPYDHAILVSEALIYGAWMLAEALSFAPSFAAAKRAGARILQTLDRKPAIVSEAPDDDNWSCSGAITLSSVVFSYPSLGGRPVLRGLSLAVPAGRTVALVGHSGCGKSTVLQLLLRTYDPDNGVLSLDGRDIRRSVSLRTLRAQFGLVQQEPVLFERSIRDNIAYGDNSREATLEEIIEAAKQANVHSFIATLPMGYDTPLVGGGAALSGGQKQRVAIARAILRKPRVLLLDEATSALDANSEKSVSEALRAAGSGRTTLLVAHRLHTVRHADIIAVIDNGVVVEAGSHDELVALRGRYWDLLKDQEGSH